MLPKLERHPFPPGWRTVPRESDEVIAKMNSDRYIIARTIKGRWMLHVPDRGEYEAKTLAGAVEAAGHFTAAYAALAKG